MNVIIHSAPWRPWQKSAIVPAAPLAKGLEFLSFSDRNTCLLSLIHIQVFSIRLLTFSRLFACTGGFEMDRDAQIQRYKERIRRYEKEKQLYKDMICTWKAEAQ